MSHEPTDALLPIAPPWDRRRKEEREERDLQPYAVRAALSRGRRVPEEPDELRTAFERDRDRLIHSNAFRRLQYKTQVFVYHEGDAYRSRLTHTLEALQVARSIASALGLNETLVEAITLAHDLGHPPFGHRGEDALHRLMKDHGGFRHNLQSLRVVDWLERRSASSRGLNLSFEVRDALLKRPVEREGTEFDPASGPMLEAQVMDLADSTAYNHHDVDDGLRARILLVDDLEKLALWRRASAHVAQHEPAATGSMRIRRTVGALIRLCIRDLVQHSAQRLARLAPRSPDEARRLPEPAIANSPEMAAEILELQRFLFRTFYRHHRLNQMAARATRILSVLFESYLADPTAMPPTYEEWAREVGVPRAVCDYVAGMTDRYAEQEYARFFLPGA
jgi:dGTPase